MTDRRLITNSMRRTFTNCRRQYLFRYNERLQPIVGAPPLKFGSLIHDCLEDFHSNKNVFFDRVINTWESDYKKEVASLQDPGDPYGADVDYDKIEAMHKLAAGMMMGYIKKHGDDLNNWKILAVEKPFRFPLYTFSDGVRGRRSGKWDMGGKLDLMFADKDGSWLMEHKTTVETDKDNYESGLMLDTQPRGYVWAARQIIEQEGWPPLRGILYNVLRKKLPMDPKHLKCKSCKGSGEPTKTAQKKDPNLTECPTCVGTGIIGVSQAQNTDTTVEKYAAAIKQYPHLDVNDYEDTLQKLTARGDRFYWRFWHHISESDVSEWERETYQVTRDIDTAESFYRNISVCNINGRKCPFRRICLEDSEMGRRNFTVRDDEHPELKAEEIDTA